MSTSVPFLDAIPSSANHSLPTRVIGVICAPQATFARVILSPRWAAVLVLTFGVTFVTGAALLETEVGRLALMDQWERTAVAFGQPVDDVRYAAFERASANGTLHAAMRALASGPLLAAGMSVLLFAVFGGRRHGAADYVQVLAVTAHAGVILALRQVVAAPLDYARETLASPASANLLFPMLDAASPLARFLGLIDVFVLWWVTVLAIGVAVLYRRPARPLALAFIGAYLAVGALLALAMAVSGGTA